MSIFEESTERVGLGGVKQKTLRSPESGESPDQRALQQLFLGAGQPDWNQSRTSAELSISFFEWLRDEVFNNQENAHYQFLLIRAPQLDLEGFLSLRVRCNYLVIRVQCECVGGSQVGKQYHVGLRVVRNSQVNFVVDTVQVAREG